MRTTKASLNHALALAARRKRWRLFDYAIPLSRSIRPYRNRIGEVILNYDSGFGWSLGTIANDQGAESVIFDHASAREMLAFLKGAAQ